MILRFHLNFSHVRSVFWAHGRLKLERHCFFFWEGGGVQIVALQRKRCKKYKSFVFVVILLYVAQTFDTIAEHLRICNTCQELDVLRTLRSNESPRVTHAVCLPVTFECQENIDNNCSWAQRQHFEFLKLPVRPSKTNFQMSHTAQYFEWPKDPLPESDW